MNIQISGNSMAPLIRDRDTLNVDVYDKPKPITSELIGKILLTHDGEEWIAHRLISDRTSMYLKGDFSSCAEAVNGIKAWGEVCEIISNNKKIQTNTSKYITNLLSIKHLQSKNKFLKKLFKLKLYLLNTFIRFFSKKVK